MIEIPMLPDDVFTIKNRGVVYMFGVDLIKHPEHLTLMQGIKAGDTVKIGSVICTVGEMQPARCMCTEHTQFVMLVK